MEEIYFDTVQQFNEKYGFETLHPLVSVARFDRQIQPSDLCYFLEREQRVQVIIRTNEV